jgi:hypothetical protein
MDHRRPQTPAGVSFRAHESAIPYLAQRKDRNDKLPYENFKPRIVMTRTFYKRFGDYDSDFEWPYSKSFSPAKLDQDPEFFLNLYFRLWFNVLRLDLNRLDAIGCKGWINNEYPDISMFWGRYCNKKRFLGLHNSREFFLRIT